MINKWPKLNTDIFVHFSEKNLFPAYRNENLLLNSLEAVLLLVLGVEINGYRPAIKGTSRE